MTSSAFRRQQERQKAEREAARREAAREAALERAREERRDAEREGQRREEARAAARAEAEAERKSAERATAVREQRRRARLAALRRATLDARAAEQRDSEQRALAQQQARGAKRAERREEERLESARARRREAARADERDEERDEERLAARRAQLRAQAREEEEERERRARALDEARANARREDEDTARAEERTTERREAAQEAARAQARDAELREGALEAARARAEEEQSERERREQASEEARQAVLEAGRAERREAERARRRDAERSSRRRAARPRPAPQGLTRLQVDGRFVIDETGARIVLRGVTVRGLERLAPETGPLRPALDESEAGLLAEIGATAIVVPLAQDLVLVGNAVAEPEEYLGAVDATIAAAMSARLYTVLQLAQISSSLPAAGSGDPPVPDRDSIDFWGLLGRRYADEPGVVFDLFRSPHDPEPGDMTAVLMPRLTWPIWIHWLLAMTGELRRWRPDAVIVARGLDSGRDLSMFPLRHADGTLVPRVVYSTNLETVDVEQAIPALALLARRAPVVVAPWKARPVEARAVETAGRRHAGVGLHWFADSWRDPDRSLVAPGEGRLELTPLGRAFRSALAQPTPASAALSPRIGPTRTQSA